MSASERAHPRYAHAAAVTLHLAGNTYAGQTTNVSRGGLCADLTAPVPTGAEIEIDMQLVFEDGAQSDALRVPARVVWCTGVNESYQVGIAFRPLAAELAEYLMMFLRYLHEEAPKPKERKPKGSVDDQFG